MPRRVRYADHAGVWPTVLASMPRVAWTDSIIARECRRGVHAPPYLGEEHAEAKRNRQR